MSYKLLKDNRYISGIAPLGVPLGFGLRYDPDTGDYELKQKGLGGSYDIGIGLAVFYKNGSWYGDALNDPKLFKDGKPTALANQISEELRREVRAAYIKGGGATKGLKLNKTALDPTGTAGINNFFPGTNPGIATAVPGGTVLSSPPGSLPKFTDPLDFPSVNEDSLFGSQQVIKERLLIYPNDILENKQDTMRITMYNYSAPSGANLFGGQKPGDILKEGLQRLSGAKIGKEDFRGTVILPIPNNAADSNSVGWAEDSMNNLTSAMLSKLNEDLGASLVTSGVLGALNMAKGVNLAPGIRALQLLMEANPDLTDPKVLKQIQALGNSLMMKQAAFDISPETILARGLGVVPNSNMELLFNSPKLRSFEFSWRMSPRSEKEAKNVRRIIRFFKQGMAPRKLGATAAGAASALLGSPNVFKLQYKTADDKPISGLNRFKLCALTGFSVNYTPDGQWSAYDKGQPVSVNIGMGFTELEPVFENDYQTNIWDGLKDAPDLDPIGPDDVGY
jgi:hypothetical protein